MKDLYWLSRHHSSIDSLINAVSSAKLPTEFQIKFLFLISKNNLLHLIKDWTPYRYELSVLEEHANLTTFKITKQINKDKKISISGIFNLIKLENSSIYIAITYEKQKLATEPFLVLFIVKPPISLVIIKSFV